MPKDFNTFLSYLTSLPSSHTITIKSLFKGAGIPDTLYDDSIGDNILNTKELVTFLTDVLKYYSNDDFEYIIDVLNKADIPSLKNPITNPIFSLKQTLQLPTSPLSAPDVATRLGLTHYHVTLEALEALPIAKTLKPTSIFVSNPDKNIIQKTYHLTFDNGDSLEVLIEPATIRFTARLSNGLTFTDTLFTIDIGNQDHASLANKTVPLEKCSSELLLLQHVLEQWNELRSTSPLPECQDFSADIESPILRPKQGRLKDFSIDKMHIRLVTHSVDADHNTRFSGAFYLTERDYTAFDIPFTLTHNSSTSRYTITSLVTQNSTEFTFEFTGKDLLIEALSQAIEYDLSKQPLSSTSVPHASAASSVPHKVMASSTSIT